MDKSQRYAAEMRLRDLGVDMIHIGTEIRYLINHQPDGLTDGEKRHLMKTYTQTQEVIDRLRVIRERCR
jgi:hypothetical protein